MVPTIESASFNLNPFALSPSAQLRTDLSKGFGRLSPNGRFKFQCANSIKPNREYGRSEWVPSSAMPTAKRMPFFALHGGEQDLPTDKVAVNVGIEASEPVDA
jgi:hypothetical protein